MAPPSMFHFSLQRGRVCRTVVIITFLLALTIIATLFFVMGESLSLSHSHIEYATVTGFFLQDDPATDPGTFDYVATGFGLINQTYDTDDFFEHKNDKSQWRRFEHKLETLNRHSGPHVDYKLLFLGRHGEGFHNVAERFYGTPMWDCFFSKLDGNGTMSWADAHITPNGVKQAEVARDAWIAQMKNGIPLPETYYTSPLDRCLSTARITFGDLKLPRSAPFDPTVKELLRETLGIHTCDRRSSKTAISNAYHYRFEPGFTENDLLWDPNLRESNSARNVRLKKLLDDIFVHDHGTVISFTGHSGSISSILEVIHHRVFQVSTGGVIPVLVRAEKRGGPAPSVTVDPPSLAPTCTANPTPPPGTL